MNLNKVRGMIYEKYGTQGQFARAIHITDSRLSNLLHHAQAWDPDMMVTVARALGMTPDEAFAIFFAEEFGKPNVTHSHEHAQD